MRFVITLLAVLAMLAGPVPATAAQVACDRGASASMAGMDMPAATALHGDVQKATVDPCCDHSGDQKMSDRNCAQACTTTCAVSTGSPPLPMGATFALAIVRLTPPLVNFVRGYEPARLERPPKSIV